MTQPIYFSGALQTKINELSNDLSQIAWETGKKSLGQSFVSMAAAKATSGAYRALCDKVDRQIQQMLIELLNKLDRKIEFGDKLIEVLRTNSGEVDPRVTKVMDKLKNKPSLSFEKLRTYASHLNTLGKDSPNQKTKELLVPTQELLQQTLSKKLRTEPDIQICKIPDGKFIKAYYNANFKDKDVVKAIDMGRALISIRYLSDMLKQGAADPFSATSLDWLERLIQDGHSRVLIKFIDDEESLNLDYPRPHKFLSCLNTEPATFNYNAKAPDQTINHLTFLQQGLLKTGVEKIGLWIHVDKWHFTMIAHSSGKACFLNQYGDAKRSPLYPYHALFDNITQAGVFLHDFFGEIIDLKKGSCSIGWTSFVNLENLEKVFS